MLGAKDVNGMLPEAVTGIPVDRKADVLFFLHAWHQTKEWKPAKKEDQPPAVFAYVIHYADGQRVEVPVVYGRGVGHWIQEKPQGLVDAAVAWAAPWAKGPQVKEAVVYQMPWKNSRPGEPIKSIDVKYDAKTGSAYGIPAVLGITTGNGGE
jgi:beta-galactosidase